MAAKVLRQADAAIVAAMKKRAAAEAAAKRARRADDARRRREVRSAAFIAVRPRLAVGQSGRERGRKVPAENPYFRFLAATRKAA